MALSDWDTLAFGPDGSSCTGLFTHKETGAQIEIYKNFAYLKDAKAWQAGSGFLKPTIGQINSGSLYIGDFEIEAIREEAQDSIFIYAIYSVDEGTPEKPKYKKYQFGGIGCSGFLNTLAIYLEKMGIQVQEGDYWCRGSRFDGGKTTEYVSNFREGKFEEHLVPDEYIISYRDAWVGVQPSTVDKFFKWLDSLFSEKFYKEEQEWIAKCRAFYAGHEGFETPTTKPGEANPTLISLSDIRGR